MTRKRLGDMKAFGRVAKQGVAISLLREGVTEALLFPASMVMARLLTPSEFGVAAAAMFFIQLASRMTDLGFGAAIVRMKEITPQHLSSVFAVNMTVGLLTFGALCAAAPFVADFYQVPATGQILPIAALSFVIAPIGSVPAALLTRDGRYRESAIVEWYFCLTFAALGVLLAWWGFSFWSVIYARVASVVVQAGCRVYFAGWRPTFQYSSKAVREVMSFGFGMQAKRLLDYTAGNLDNLVVGKLMGMTALGLYDKAFSTMNRVLSRTNSAGPGVMFRIFALIHEEPDRFKRAYSKVVMSASLLGFPLFAVLAATGPQVMVVLFGANWLPAALPFQILCFAGALKLLNSYAGSATSAAGRIWSEVWRQVVFIGLIVAGVYALRSWGPIGAAIGVLAATAVMTVMMHVLLRRVTGISWREIAAPLTPAMTCALGAAGVVLLVEKVARAVTQPPEWLLLCCQFVAAGLFFVLFVLFSPQPSLRALAVEMTDDLAPRFLKQNRWFRRWGEMNRASLGE